MKNLIGILLFLIVFLPAFAQRDTLVVKARILDGDTLPVIDLAEVPILAPYMTGNEDDAKRFGKLVRMVKKVYPYARLAGLRFTEINVELEKADAKERKRLIKGIEDEVKDKYGEELKRLSFSQGKILIKLVDRETGNTSYDLVKEFRGSFMAFFYQNFARIWGYNLKTRYDPTGEDKDIEMIVRLIEQGQL